MSGEATGVVDGLLREVQARLWSAALLRRLVHGGYWAGGILVVAGIVHTRLLPIEPWKALLLALLPVVACVVPAALRGRPSLLDAAGIADHRLGLCALLSSALEQAAVPPPRRAGAAGVVIAQAAQAAPGALERVRRWPRRRWSLRDAIPVGLAVAGMSLLWAPGAPPVAGFSPGVNAPSSLAPRPAPAFAELQPLLEQLRGVGGGAGPGQGVADPGNAKNRQGRPLPGAPQAGPTLADRDQRGTARTPGLAESVQPVAAGRGGGDLPGADTPASAGPAPKAAELLGPRRDLQVARREGKQASRAGVELPSGASESRAGPLSDLAPAPARGPAGSGRGRLAPHLAGYTADYLTAVAEQ